MDVTSLIQKYYKVVLAQLGAYGLSWYLITYVFLGPLPVVSPAFKEQVKQSPETAKRVIAEVPVQIAKIGAAVKERLPVGGSSQSTTTHTGGDSHLPSPWVLVIPTPMGGARDGGYPTVYPTQSIPTSPLPTSGGPFPTTGQRPTQAPAPTSRPQPTRVPTPTPIPDTPATLAQREQDTLNEINARRAEVGSPPVRAITTLTNAARAHAAWMAGGSGMSRCGHSGENGSSPLDRAHAAGYRGYGLGEIVACAYPTPKGAVNAWMHSPGHKAIMLDAHFRVVGIGWGGNQAVGVFGE